MSEIIGGEDFFPLENPEEIFPDPERLQEIVLPPMDEEGRLILPVDGTITKIIPDTDGPCVDDHGLPGPCK